MVVNFMNLTPMHTKLPIMKIKYFFATIAAAFALTGCSDPDNNSFTPEQLLVGRWKLETWYSDTPVDIDNDGTASTDLYSQWDGCYKNSEIKFNADMSTTITYTGPENNPSCPPGLIATDNWAGLPWYVEPATADSPNGTIVFTGSDYLESYPIVRLTDTDLIIKGAGLLVNGDASTSYYTDGYLKFTRENLPR
jgi:hypothetical protein